MAHLTARDVYTPADPLGSPIGDGIVTLAREELERLSLFFDPQNKLVSRLHQEKSLIVGRKGSGKTTLLASVGLSEPDAILIFLPSDDVFARMIIEVNKLSDGIVFVEQVGRLWEFVLWGTVFNKIVEIGGDSVLTDFCKELGVVGRAPPYVLIETILNKIRKLPPDDTPLPLKIPYQQFGGVSFLQAKQAACDYLKSENKHVYLLMDSLEDLKLHIPSYGTAVSGLLRAIGEFNELRPSWVTLRCCLPAEKYWEFNRLSTNPLKDFRAQMLLHWSAGELLQLSAIRYSRFLREYHAGFYEKEIEHLDLHRRAGLEEFWHKIFPYNVESRIKFSERPSAYILRHTQLLPRHILFLFNEIIQRSIKEDGKAYDIDPRHIRVGTTTAEVRVVNQILESYTSPFRNPREACDRTLRELKSVFTWSEFDQVAGRVVRQIPGVSDRTELMAMLTEIGAVGRKVDETEKYVVGVFEYMLPHQLIFSERDTFCIHPVFSEIFHVNVDYPGVKSVYTYWSGLTDDDLKSWS